MAFTIPTFNLLCDVFDGPWPAPVRIVGLACNLQMARRASIVSSVSISADQIFAHSPCLLVPAGSDVRDASCANNPDYIECPSGSGRFYFVNGVDDVAKGFDNEFRLVSMSKMYFNVDGGGSFPGLFWPTPIP